MPDKKYKFITIRQDNGEMFEGKPVYRVFNSRSDGQLAVLSYYKPWKQYVFSSIPVLGFMEKEIPHA